MKQKPPFDAEHPGKYPDAMAAMPEMFFRVRRENDRLGFKPDTKFDYIWLQYYWFCYFNDADEPLDEGDHEGDWLCVDLTLKVPKGDPQPLKHAVLCSSFFHNHSREFFVNRSKLKLEGDHVNVYMEANCNEPWPNAAPNRDWRDDHHNEQNSSWPVNRKGEKGFWANSRYEKPTGWPPYGQEKQIVREHRGGGPTFTDGQYKLVDLADQRPSNRDETLVAFIFAYKGWYGAYAPSTTGFHKNDCPSGPPSQTRMWNRNFKGANGERVWLEYRGEHRNGDPQQPLKTGEDPRIYLDSQPHE
jgi:hypothetical protein